MKKVLILGVGAQGSTVAQRLDEEPNVEEIVCADYDEEAVNGLVKSLKKARGLKVDGSIYEQVVYAARGVDIIINALPLEYGKNALEAALEVKANYQDFAACGGLVEAEDEGESWVEGIKYMYDHYGKRFADIGKLALIGTGSAPGLICVLSRRAVRELDSCETINMMVYEGVVAKRFLPFWWSPRVALGDMAFPAVAFENGELIRTEPFSRPLVRKFPELDNMEVSMIEHAHDEPVYMGINSRDFFKGARNIYFKYGGSGIEFAHPLYKMGILSSEEKDFDGQKIIPFEFTLRHIPPPPKFKEEIQEILDEGLVSDIGAFVIEEYGKKDGKDVMVDIHLSAPGLVESFERAGITGEMYQTGQCGFFFTKMFLQDKFPQTGLISSDMLNDEQVDYYLSLAAEKDITYTIEIKNQ